MLNSSSPSLFSTDQLILKSSSCLSRSEDIPVTEGFDIFSQHLFSWLNVSWMFLFLRPPSSPPHFSTSVICVVVTSEFPQNSLENAARCSDIMWLRRNHPAIKKKKAPSSQPVTVLFSLLVLIMLLHPSCHVHLQGFDMFRSDSNKAEQMILKNSPVVYNSSTLPDSPLYLRTGGCATAHGPCRSFSPFSNITPSIPCKYSSLTLAFLVVFLLSSFLNQIPSFISLFQYS